MTLDTAHGQDLTIIFDLDGTLVDTAPDLLRALNHVLSGFEGDVLTLHHVRSMVGQGARALVIEGLDFLKIEANDALIDQLTDDFLVYYFDNVAVESRLFPGLEALLPNYFDNGVRLGVCTNKLERPSRKLLSAMGVADNFHTIVGRDTLDTMKPDPKTLTSTIERAGGQLARSVYVGDSITDVETAKAAGVPCVLVSFGYTRTPVTELGGDIIIDHYQELDGAIGKLLMS
jgi:phosphoglycolate phosphatase